MFSGPAFLLSQDFQEKTRDEQDLHDFHDFQDEGFYRNKTSL